VRHHDARQTVEHPAARDCGEVLAERREARIGGRRRQLHRDGLIRLGCDRQARRRLRARHSSRQHHGKNDGHAPVALHR
jgi:hypothetical protein